jgi:hypothetical protein
MVGKHTFIPPKALAVALMLLPLLAVPVTATNYLQAYAKGVVKPYSNLAISGQITNTSASDTIAGVNVSANVTGGLANSALTAADGTFSFNITSPILYGGFDVFVAANNVSRLSKWIPIYVTNVTGGSISYVSDLPPYSAGNTFTVNVTLKNGTAPAATYTPNVTIYTANGQRLSWTVANNSASSDASGVISYNITVPASAAPGQYAIIVERGAVSSVFGVDSGYRALVSPQTDAGSVTLNFAAGSSVNVYAKVKTTAGLAVSSGITSVTLYVTLPNGTVRSSGMTANNQSSYPGYYNANFTGTSAAGTYYVRVDAVVGSTTVQGYSIFNVRGFNARLEPQTDFFMDWGGSSAFGAGQTVGLNIIATSLTNDEVFTVPANISACDTTYLKLVDVFYANGTSINSTIQNAAFSTGRYMMADVCRIQFTAPAASSPYGVKVNVTVGGSTETAEGYFSVQKYFLKPTAVAGFGGEMDMMSMLAPGENTTISLTAYNVSNNAALGGGNITNVVVRKIKPLKFTLGLGEITTGINYSVSYGDTPTITLTIPSTMLGPAAVDMDATIGGVGGETVSGNTFFIANYLMGGMAPQGAGEGQGGGGPPFSSCTGTQTFTGTVMEAKTATAVKSGAVVVNTLSEASEEATGKDMLSCFTLSANGTSDSNGLVSVNVTFNPSCSFSGFYFIVLNASYQGKTAGIPTDFMCKNLNFMPKLYSTGSTDEGWRMAPSSGVRITMTNITRLNDSRKIGNSTVRLPRVFNFNPAKGGGTVLLPTAAFSAWTSTNFLNYSGTGSGRQNNISFTIYPQNFTLLDYTNITSWPNGFVDLQPQVCTEDMGGSPNWNCDTGFGGFQVVPFDAWVEGFQWGGSQSVNSSVSYIVGAKTNVSLNCSATTNCTRVDKNSVYTGTNNTGFTVKIGRPWEGQLTTLSATAVLVDDGWNSTSDTTTERWNVSFTIPATISKGEAQIMILVNSSYGETASTDLWTTLTKYDIKIPYDEGIDEWFGGSIGSDDFNATSGWNMTRVNEIVGVRSQSNPGQFCYHYGLNTTRYSNNGTRFVMQYNSTTNFILVDNTTAGSYDFLVFNASGRVGYVNVNNRTLSLNAFGIEGLYFNRVDGCYVKLSNATATSAAEVAAYGALPTWAGSGEANKEQVVPYIVKLGGNPVVDAQMHVNGMIKQSDEGFGFESKLVGGYSANDLVNTAAGENYSYVNASTDSMGVAFLRVNITNSGRFSIFWKVNVSAADYDIASMSSGTQIETRKFSGWGDAIYWLPNGRVTLYWSNNTAGPGADAGVPAWSAFSPGSTKSFYNGTVVESVAAGFVRDTVPPSAWRIAYSPSEGNRTCLDDDLNFTYGNLTDADHPDNDDYPVSCFYWNSTSNNLNTTYGAEAQTWLAVGSYVNNTPAGASVANTTYDVLNNLTMVFYQDGPRPASMVVTSANANVPVKVCAETFDAPTRKPIEGAKVKLFAMNFDVQGPAQRKWLTMYNPINDTVRAAGGDSEPESNILTGPKGCVAFNITYPGGWPNGCREIQGSVTRGSDTENVWVGRVCR